MGLIYSWSGPVLNWINEFAIKKGQNKRSGFENWITALTQPLFPKHGPKKLFQDLSYHPP